MREEEKGILNNIKSVYGNLTTLEKEIADFFLNGPDIKDFSAQNVAAHLFISTPSLTRFAQKCGYSGYRQFLFDFQKKRVWKEEKSDEMNGYIFHMLSVYQSLLDETKHLFDEKKIKQLCSLFASCNRVYLYGIGSSGLVATEMQIRLMRTYDGNELGYCGSGMRGCRVKYQRKDRGGFKILKGRKDGRSYDSANYFA